jgi:acetylxylan esterase
MAFLNILAAFLLSSTATLGQNLSNPFAQCHGCPPVQVITARGSTEPAGEGSMGILAAKVAFSNQCGARAAVDYPASVSSYAESTFAGTASLTYQLTEFVEKCPDSQIVLLGVSQGAQIIGDCLCGGGGMPRLGPETPPIATEIGDHGE